jgi:hypothetical protein
VVLDFNDTYLSVFYGQQYWAADVGSWVRIKGPATGASDYSLLLPNAQGANGQTLVNNGSGTLSWGSAFTTGDAKLTFKATADSGWVMMDDGTIGSAGSGATTRANADTESLYSLLWTNISNTYPAVSGGRGASAAADFAANKTLALSKVLGRSLLVGGAGSGLTSRALGETGGAETVTLDTTMIPSHNHTQDAHNHSQNAHSHSSIFIDSSSR